MTQILFSVLLAVALDRFLPDRGGLQLRGWYTDWVESIEQRFNGGTRGQGVSAVLVALLPLVLAVFVVRYVLGQVSGVLAFAFDVYVLYLCLDLYRLGQTADAVSTSLESGDVHAAAEQLEYLVGKRPAETTEAGIAHASVEAILKQANTLIMAPVFWFVLLGPVGAVLQHLAAILDRQWGHRDQRFVEFGWAAARVDDLLNWAPARLTALSYAIMGSFEDALHCWRRQAGMWSDINSGPLLASGLGAMHMESCDTNDQEDAYGNRVSAPTVVPDAGHVRRVMALVWRVLLFWGVVGLMMAGVHLYGSYIGA